jgi:hypothetical protein
MGVMSTGLFMGVRASHIDEAQASATAFLDAFNVVLKNYDIATYVDPHVPPNVYRGYLFGTL